MNEADLFGPADREGAPDLPDQADERQARRGPLSKGDERVAEGPDADGAGRLMEGLAIGPEHRAVAGGVEALHQLEEDLFAAAQPVIAIVNKQDRLWRRHGLSG